MHCSRHWLIGQNKVFEIELSAYPRFGFDLGLSINYRPPKTDHWGLFIELSLLWVWLSASFYDRRHAEP